MNFKPFLGRLEAAASYAVARLQERTTWQGVIAVVAAFGLREDPSQAAAIVTAGVAGAGLLHMLFPQNGVLK